MLHLAGAALVRAVQPLRYSRSFALRQAVLHIARPGNQTRVILLAVGLGSFFILGVRTLQANLLRDFAIQAGANAPDMFLIDIQADQRDDWRPSSIEANGDGTGAEDDPDAARAGRGRPAGAKWISTATSRRGAAGCRANTPSPTVPSSRPTKSSSTGNGGATRRCRARRKCRSRSASPTATATATSASARASRSAIEMRFDVLGRIITARVTSIRRVDWQDFRAGGFMFVFRPGTFDGAPHTYHLGAAGAARFRRARAHAGRAHGEVSQRHR